MVFSNTTGKNGMIQKFEFWTRMPDGTVTGDLLKQVTGLINSGFDNIMPLLLSFTDYIRWDDLNHSDKPVGKINLASGQSGYKLTEDANQLDILNLTNVQILTSATGTEYTTLERMTIDSKESLEAISPNTNTSGTPTMWLEVGNIIYLYPKPNYSATDGIKLFFEREQSPFVSTDTTKEIGIPKPFHELPVLYAALDWNMVNRTEDGNLISRLENRIAVKQSELKNLIDLKYPTKSRLSVAYEDNR